MSNLSNIYAATKSGFAALALTFALAPAVFAEQDTVYVSDVFYVPLFSGQSTRHKIVHRGIKSGATLKVLSRDEKAGFTQVETSKGLKGWIQNQYVSNEPIARTQLRNEQRKRIELQQAIDQLRSKNKLANQSSSTLEKQVNSLSKQNQVLTDELASIKKISSNAIKLDRNNRELLQKNELLKVKIAELQTENARLADKSNRDWFLRGALAVAIGALLAVILPKLKPRTRHSDWS